MFNPYLVHNERLTSKNRKEKNFALKKRSNSYFQEPLAVPSPILLLQYFRMLAFRISAIHNCSILIIFHFNIKTMQYFGFLASQHVSLSVDQHVRVTSFQQSLSIFHTFKHSIISACQHFSISEF